MDNFEHDVVPENQGARWSMELVEGASRIVRFSLPLYLQGHFLTIFRNLDIRSFSLWKLKEVVPKEKTNKENKKKKEKQTKQTKRNRAWRASKLPDRVRRGFLF